MEPDFSLQPEEQSPREEQLERRCNRERRARKTAEELLESKSRELFLLNQVLEDARDRLEETVQERTVELVSAKESAELASRAKSVFLANMSHELRTPMNGVLSLTTLLADSPLETDQYELVDMIDTSARQLLTLLNDLLDISKIEAGQVELQEGVFHLGNCITSAYSLMSPRADGQGIEFLKEVDPKLEHWFAGDDLRLRQVLVNLLGNAVKFTQRGRVILRALQVDDDSYTSESGSVMLRFEVQDTGAGIRHEDQGAIFRPFEQADGSVTRKYGGTGLGLAISNDIVKMMNGRIGLVSEPGIGSTFWFEVPLNTAPAPNLSATDESTSDLSPLNGKRILLAEDNIINQKVAVRVLERFGCTVDIAMNGEEALRRVRASMYDIVLMDCQMPEMSGLEASRAIRDLEGEACSMVPIIAMTANAMPGDREECLSAGMNAYLSKPIDQDVLAKTLIEWVT
jgi:two-component system, sensor histidine kinase and response regulator